MRLRTFISGIVVLPVLMASAVVPAFAAGASPGNVGNGMRISPIRSDLTINKGESKSVTISVTDVSPAPLTLQVVINDFLPSTNESGTPELLLNNQPAPSHSLKKIAQPVPNFTLQPNQQKDVTINLNVPSGLAAGGYYGAVRFLPASANASKNLSLSASVASLVLVTVPGNYKEQMSIASMEIQQSGHTHSIFSTSKNLQVLVRFQNTGDVQEQPFGKVQVKKGSKVVSTAEINNTDPRDNVLPNSIRRFSAPLSGVGSFGKYTVQGAFGYGSGQLLTATTTFYVIPTPLILAVIAIIVVLILLAIFVPKAIRRHDRSVLRRSGRR